VLKLYYIAVGLCSPPVTLHLLLGNKKNPTISDRV